MQPLPCGRRVYLVVEASSALVRALTMARTMVQRARCLSAVATGTLLSALQAFQKLLHLPYCVLYWLSWCLTIGQVLYKPQFGR